MDTNRSYQHLIHELQMEKQRVNETSHELLNEDMRESLGELSLADNHPADMGTELYRREQDMGRIDGLKSRVSAIDAALNRWQKGLYGVCERCGQNIGMERLEAIPYTTLCTRCSQVKTKTEGHTFYADPVEDELLYPPYRRTVSADGKIEFDEEDGWQAVARYGTSDSLQDLGTRQDIEDPANLYEASDEWIGAVEGVETIPTEEDNGGRSTIHYSRDHSHH